MTDMGPGPALDALVAEKVLGWRWRRSSVTGRRCLFAPNGWPEWMDSDSDGSEEIVRDVPAGMVPALPVSTDLTTCERAAEEWRGRSDRPRWYRLCSGSRDGTLPAAALFEGSVCIVEWSGETLAHALSLALLKACGS